MLQNIEDFPCVGNSAVLKFERPDLAESEPNRSVRRSGASSESLYFQRLDQTINCLRDLMLCKIKTTPGLWCLILNKN